MYRYKQRKEIFSLVAEHANRNSLSWTKGVLIKEWSYLQKDRLYTNIKEFGGIIDWPYEIEQ